MISINYVILKILVRNVTNREFLQYFKNRTGDKLKLPKRESPAGIGRVGMSEIKIIIGLFWLLTLLVLSKHNYLIHENKQYKSCNLKLVKYKL